MSVPLIAVLPGDGIGPEIVAQAVRVLDCIKQLGFECEYQESAVGLAGLKASGKPVPDDTFELAQRADAVLFGAVGDPSYNIGEDKTQYPDYAIKVLRLGLGLFVSLREVSISPALASMSPLKDRRCSGTQLVVVRELSGDVYFGEPKGQRLCIDEPFVGQAEGFDTMRYAYGEVERAAKIAFGVASKRQCRLVSADKANVLEASRLWRSVVNDMKALYPNISVTHQYADNVAMQLIQDPKVYDVIFTGNLFGDLLSDVASVLAGSIGLPAAAMFDENGKGFYEPGHGTALDIAGKNVANPISSIRTIALMLRYSFDRGDLADLIETAISDVLERDIRTLDIAESSSIVVSTSEMGSAIIESIRIFAKKG